MACGRIHPINHTCAKREESKKVYKQMYRDRQKGKKDIRFTQKWKNKANEIKDRDLGMCQMCIRKIDILEDMKAYNYVDTQVHHIIKVKVDEERAFDNSNLITLCRYHHGLVENKNNYVTLLSEIAEEQENISRAR